MNKIFLSLKVKPDLLRQYQEAELEISDLALNSDSDSDDDMDGSNRSTYTDEPPTPPQLT